MINTRQLEKKWYKYKAKKIFSFLFGFLFILLSFAGLYYAYIKYTEEKSKDMLGEGVLTRVELSDDIKEKLNVEEDKTPKMIESDIVSKIEKVSLEPVIPIIDMEKEERKVSHRISLKKPVSSHRKTTVKKHIKAKPSAYLTANELATVNTSLDSRKIKKINMTTSSINYIETIKQKFIKTKKPREALLLAKAYYAKKEYSKSEEWALRANKLNSQLDESWLMFAKSKVKLGKRDEALKILVSYYRKTHSSTAKALIEKIKTERL
jgi:tetratricopeptide (TPR) repeat protein